MDLKKHPVSKIHVYRNDFILNHHNALIEDLYNLYKDIQKLRTYHLRDIRVYDSMKGIIKVMGFHNQELHKLLIWEKYALEKLMERAKKETQKD